MSAITYDELESHLHSGLSWMSYYLLRVHIASAYLLLYTLFLIMFMSVRKTIHVIERRDLEKLSLKEMKALLQHCREFLATLDRVIESSVSIKPLIGSSLMSLIKKLGQYRNRVEDRIEAMELSQLPECQEMIKTLDSLIGQATPQGPYKDWRAMID